MSGIKRFNHGVCEYPGGTFSEMNQEADGDYVLHSDHEAEVARLRAEVEENEKVINVWRGRTQRAEAEVEALRSFVSDYISAFRNGFDGDDHLLSLAKSLLSRETGDLDVE